MADKAPTSKQFYGTRALDLSVLLLDTDVITIVPPGTPITEAGALTLPDDAVGRVAFRYGTNGDPLPVGQPGYPYFAPEEGYTGGLFLTNYDPDTEQVAASGASSAGLMRVGWGLL